MPGCAPLPGRSHATGERDAADAQRLLPDDCGDIAHDAVLVVAHDLGGDDDRAELGLAEVLNLRIRCDEPGVERLAGAWNNIP
ncbi:MAG: hypothetical protein JWN62_4686 [Acidimicrobiales bacterium]|nr:hypothetical protein [Acidimicrobiales bacterium]